MFKKFCQRCAQCLCIFGIPALSGLAAWMATEDCSTATQSTTVVLTSIGGSITGLLSAIGLNKCCENNPTNQQDSVHDIEAQTQRGKVLQRTPHSTPTSNRRNPYPYYQLSPARKPQ
jgi:hypothetical protein